MYRTSIIILCLLFCFCCQHVVYGGPVRTWTSRSGKFTVKAELLSFDPPGVVILRRDDGKTIKVPMDKLSKEDPEVAIRYFVMDQAKREAEPVAVGEEKSVAALEKLGAKIKNLMADEQVELGGPIVNSVDMVLVPIPAGEFMMGSPASEPDRWEWHTPSHSLANDPSIAHTNRTRNLRHTNHSTSIN